MPRPGDVPYAPQVEPGQAQRSTSYRPDIDGLRALAVLAVIMFHAGVPGFAGGYIGVDVFFVVSGYLITQLLSAPHTGSTARQLGEFYVRRARRILPALLVMCAAAAVIGWLLLLPEELEYLGEYLAGAAVFASNMTEWHGGYFVLAFVDPLRHLWSIAVEEQFYLFYPLLLVLLTRYLPRRRTAALVSLGLSSLLVCIWASYTHPAVNYYAAPTRAWELLLGAVLQSAGLRALRPRLANELLAALAALALAACVSLYAPSRFPYPSVYTLLPCAATAALLATGGEGSSYVNRALAWPPLVFVGLISYSLYLWHWPLLRFAGYYHVTPLGGAARAALLVLIVLLSIFSWRYVEQPVRTRRILRGTRGLVIAATLGSIAVGLTGLVLWLSDGFPRRFPPELRALLDEPKGPLIARCMAKSLEEIRAGAWCAFGDLSPDAPAMLLWGDSHALALIPAYEELARAHGVRLYLTAKSRCLPVLGVTDLSVDPVGNRACAAYNDAVVRGIEAANPATVVLAARWQNGPLAPAPGSLLPAHESPFEFGLRQTAAAVAARDVCVVLDVPTLKYPGEHALLLARRRQIDDDFVAVSAREAHAVLAAADEDVRKLAAAGVVRYVDPTELLCAGERCLYKHDGRSLYYDTDHLSHAGAMFVRSALESCFVSPRH